MVISSQNVIPLKVTENLCSSQMITYRYNIYSKCCHSQFQRARQIVLRIASFPVLPTPASISLQNKAGVGRLKVMLESLGTKL